MERDELSKPSIKKLKSCLLSDRLQDPVFQELFQSNWHGKKPLKTPDFEIISHPFRVCRISNFLTSESQIDEIKNELLDVKTRRNCIDLYQFEQTEDLANATSKHIERLYKAFETDLTSWMERNTKIDLNGKMSMSSACYSDTDYLLCHDDNLGDRRIAFVLYLSKNWTKEDGGALDLFDTDEDNLPRNIVRSLVPEYNSLVFFEVVDNSFHQVAEVTSADKSRWTINGWFHGPLPDVNKGRRPAPIYPFFEPEETDVDLESWVSKTYLIQDIVKEIQKAVEQDSFIYLPNFLLAEKCRRISEEIKKDGIRWEKVGPADVRNYEVADYKSLPEALRQLLDLFKSIDMFHLLKEYTELDLVPDREDMKPRMRIELQRWSQGCYMLINDKQMENNDENVKEYEEEVRNAQGDISNSTDEELERMKSTDEDEEFFFPSKKQVKCKNYERGGNELDARMSETEKHLQNIDEKEENEDCGGNDERIEKEGMSVEKMVKEQGKNNPLDEEGKKESKHKNDGNIRNARGARTHPNIKSVQSIDNREENKNTEMSSKLSDKEMEYKNYKTRDSDNAKTNIKSTKDKEAGNTRQEKKTDETPRDERSNRITDSSELSNQKMEKLKSPKGKGKMVISPYKNSHVRLIDYDDSDVSDIGDYLSDSQNDSESETSENDDCDVAKPGTLDVLLQFHTENATEDATIDYVVPTQKDGALIHVPPQDNHLCLVYRTAETSRCNKYVNHYCKGYFYTLVCSYDE